MRIIVKKHLPRRTFLRGMGVTLSLPLLDSMVPALTAQTKTAANPLPHLSFIYIPHGAVMLPNFDRWTPKGEGSNFEFSPILKPLDPFRKNVLVINGLGHHQADSLGDGGADHARSGPTWLSAVHPKRTEGEDVRAGTTIDQMAAARIGQDTPLPSLELATEDMTGLVGACDTGYSCAYMNTIAWKTPTTPLPMEINPRVVFERLFGEGGTAEQRQQRMQEDRSILDAITRQVGHFEAKLPSEDRTKLNQYLDNVREIERRIQLSEKQSQSHLRLPDAPVGVPDSFDEHAKLMFDMMALSYQADITRISTFMLARELSQRTYPQVGVPDPHHATSHHQNDPVKLNKLVKINNYHVSLLGHFLEKLRTTPDGDGSLLDHSIVLYGSGMSNSNVHNHDPLPVVVAGGRIKGGQHLVYKDHTPMANLLVSILDRAGVPVDKVGDSTGDLGEV
jgi:Protein of unknown function (DUF1552)